MDAHLVARETVDWLAARPPWTSYAVVFVVASLEYLIPPIPHDIVAVVAGILAARGVLDPALALTIITFGSVLGALAAWRVGLLAANHENASRFVARFIDAASLQKMTDRFQKHGRLLLIANRFLPGLRSTLLFGAGLFRMRAVEVAICSGISAALWNGLLLGGGVVLGKNLDEVLTLVERYSVVASIVVTIVIASLVTRAILHRRRRRRASIAPDDVRPGPRVRRV